MEPDSRDLGKRKRGPSILEQFRSRLREEEEKGPVGTLEMVKIYEEFLVRLVYNSKPVITDLCLIAGDLREKHAEGIANAICYRILKVPMEQKLPSLYLLDSIVKNVGREYLRYFEARLPEVFIETYMKMCSSLHPAMDRLLKTWQPLILSSVLRKIEFSLQQNHKQTSSRDLQQSGSQSPCQCDICINQKRIYSWDLRRLRSQSPYRHSGHINQKAKHSSDLRESRPQSPSRHNTHIKSKYLENNHHSQYSSLDPQHTRLAPTLQSYRQKSSFRYRTYDVDHHELPNLHPGFGRTRTVAEGVVKDTLNHPWHSSYPRIGPNIDTFSDRAINMSLLSGLESGRSSNLNAGRTRGCSSGRGAQNREDLVACNLNNRYDDLHARSLIDTYENKDTSQEKLSKFQRLDTNGTGDLVRNDSQSSKEEYIWETMSPTLPSRSQRYTPSSFGHNTGLTDVAYLWKDFESNRHNQSLLPSFTDSAIAKADVASHKEPMLQYRSSFPAEESNMLSESSRQTSAPRSQGKPLQLPSSASGIALSVARKESTSFGNMPFERISSSYSDFVKGEMSTTERHLAPTQFSPDDTSVFWSPVHRSKQVKLPTVSSYQKFTVPFDLESCKSEEDVRPNQPFFLSRQQIDTGDNRTKLNPLSSGPSSFPLNLKSQRTTNLSIESHDFQGRCTLAPTPVSPHLVSQAARHIHGQEAVSGLNLSNLLSGTTSLSSPPLRSSLYNFRPLCLPLHPDPSPVASTAITTLAASLPAAVAPPPPPPPASAPLLQPPLGVIGAPLPHPAAPPHHTLASYGDCSALPPPPCFHPARPLPIIPPPFIAQSNSSEFTYLSSGSLLLLSEDRLPTSSQTGPGSQITDAVISESPVDAYSGLISSLLAQGFIPLIPPNPSQDTVGIEFKAELLKVRHESSIDALYGDLPRQCMTCGMRFKFQEEHNRHIDWHMINKAVAKNYNQKSPCNWYMSVQEWLSGVKELGTVSCLEFSSLSQSR